ncbi:MAG: TldD/PmbA family protein [Thermoanaerobaculia bacterium]
MNARAHDLGKDSDDAIRLVAGMLRRGETGEALRERRRVAIWSASETGLHSPARIEERGTAVRIRRDGQSLLIARSGNGPEALRDAVREAARRGGGAPFFKAVRRPPDAPFTPAPELHPESEVASAALATALARAIPDPRGLSLSVQISRIVLERAVITPRAFLPCGDATRLEASGVINRPEGTRTFAFQSSSPFEAAVLALTSALAEAIRPAPRVSPAEGEIDVVFSPSASAVFWHEVVGHPLEAAGGEGGSVLARVLDAAVGPAGLDVVDDATRADLPGGYVVDDEGMAARPVALLRDGRVAGVLTDRRSSGRADSNGHGRTPDYRRPPRARMSNLIVPPGRSSVAELVERCGEGLYVTHISAGAADPESGRFVLFVDGAEMIRRGRLAAALTPFALSGEILSALGHVDPNRGNQSLPALGLSVCIKGGDALPVGGSAPAVLVRKLKVRVSKR